MPDDSHENQTILISDDLPSSPQGDGPLTPEPPKQHETVTYDDVHVKSRNLTSELSLQTRGKYTVRRSIGKGGMKVVLKVRDRDAARDVAMAVMLKPSHNVAVRFVQEARITANLEHPNIVPVHEIGVNSKGEPYFTMKHLSGENLLRILRKLSAGDERYSAKFSLFRLLEIFRKVCDAIAFAHAKGVLHLDLKPENVQVGEFGEVLVLDWGLARLVDHAGAPPAADASAGAPPPDSPYEALVLPATESQSESVHERLDGTLAEVTIDGVVKGTPGYMAPEQASGMNSRKDERTDIYVLGSLLYAMLTLRHPVAGNAQAILEATVKGDIIPPRRRAPERNIPKALEAVALKAMALKPEDRYQNVMSLADDIDAYLNGYATSAEKASIPVHFMLMLRRHKALSTAISLLLVTLALLCGYAAYDYYMRWGKWIPLYEADFTKRGVNLVELRFMDAMNSAKTPSWKAGKQGLLMRPNEWLWLENLPVRGDVTIKAEIDFDSPPDTVDVCVNSLKGPLSDSSYLPAGYAFRFAGRRALYDAIMRNPRSGKVDTSFCSPTGYDQNVAQTLVVRREGTLLTFEVNGRITARMDDFAPLLGEGLESIGMRTFAKGARLLNLEVRRLSLPAKASPLVAGDSLVEIMRYKDAVAKYLTIAQDYPNTAVARQALSKAYLLVDNLESDRDAALRKTRSLIAENMPKELSLETTINGDALRLWRSGKYQEALVIAEQMLKIDPTVNMPARLLSTERTDLCEYDAESLVLLCSKTRRISSLDIRGIGLSSLLPLVGKQFTYLDCSGNKRLKSIQALKGMPLSVLVCDDTSIINFTPLKDTPIRALSCARTCLESLEPLHGKRLYWLDCSETLITSVKPLSRMPLRFLSLEGCANLKDLSPLAACTDLEVLIIPETAGNIDALRKLPRLKYLDTIDRPGGLTSVEDFWHARGKKDHARPLAQ